LARSSKNRDKQFGSEQKAQKLFIIYRAELATRDCLTVLTVFAVYGPNTTPRLWFGNQKLASDMRKMKMAPQSGLLQIENRNISVLKPI